MIKDLVNQENLKLSNAVSTAKGLVATHNNVIGGLPPVSLMLGGKTVQNGTPAPDNKVDIVGAGEGGSLSVKSTAKNIFGGLALAQALVDSGSTNVVLDTDAKTVTFKQNTNHADKPKTILFNNFKENTQYTFRLKGNLKVSGATPHTINLSIYYADNTRKVFNVSEIGEFDELFTTPVNKQVDRFIYSFADTDTATLYYEECGVFEGIITADEFEAYTGTEVNIPLSAPLYESDTITYNMTGNGEESHVMDSVVFDGSDDENWLLYDVGKSTERLIIKASKGQVANAGYCNIANVAKKASEGYNGGEYIAGVSADGFVIYRPFITGAISGVASVDTWKQYLRSNSVEFIYELLEPEVTPLTEAQITAIESLLSQAGLTNVMSEGMVESAYLANNADGKAVVLLNEIIKTNYLKSAKGYELEDLDKSVNNFKTQNQQEHAVFTGEINTLKGRISALELKDWTRLGNVTTLDLSSYKEVLVVLDDGDGHDVTINIPKYELEEAKNSYGSGVYLTSTLNWGGYITMDEVGVYDKKFYVNGALSGICNVSIYVR